MGKRSQNIDIVVTSVNFHHHMAIVGFIVIFITALCSGYFLWPLLSSLKGEHNGSGVYITHVYETASNCRHRGLFSPLLLLLFVVTAFLKIILLACMLWFMKEKIRILFMYLPALVMV